MRHSRNVSLVLAVSLTVVASLLPTRSTARTITTREGAPRLRLVRVSGLHVHGNRILNSSDQALRLLGVNRGAANACIQGWGIFSGPVDAGTVKAMRKWKINAVRIPLNEDCWLGINRGSVPRKYYGTAYRSAIEDYVRLLGHVGIAVILDLHWSAPGTEQANNQQPMADRNHSPAFWRSVARTFKKNQSVAFDLYNEPYPDNNNDSSAAWKCWRDGGTCPGVSFVAAGMQELVRAVRSAGARNLIIATGVGWGGIISHWAQYRPNDPDHNLAAGIHVYPGSQCHTVNCWDSQIATVTRKYPVVVGEFGETDCGDSFVNELMSWLDAHSASYLAWHWWPLGAVACSNFALIRDYYTADPTGYGKGLHDHLARLYGAG